MTLEEDYSQYIGVESAPRHSTGALESDSVRRFVQAIMDDDPLYHDAEFAAATRYRSVVAPPLYPVHGFRRANATPDPLETLTEDRNADGAGAGLFGLPPISSPYKRLLNGGNEIEFFRCLHLGEKAVSHSKYADVELKQGKSGKLLTVVIETRYLTESGELLLVNRQTLIWR